MATLVSFIVRRYLDRRIDLSRLSPCRVTLLIFKTIDVYSMDPEVAVWGAPTTTSNCRLAGLCDRTSGPVFVDSFSFGLCGSYALRLLLSYFSEMKRTWTETTRLEWTRRRDAYRERKQLPPLEQLRTSDEPKDRKAYEGR